MLVKIKIQFICLFIEFDLQIIIHELNVLTS